MSFRWTNDQALSLDSLLQEMIERIQWSFDCSRIVIPNKIMTGITFDQAVIKFTEAKIELYEIIEVYLSCHKNVWPKKRCRSGILPPWWNSWKKLLVLPAKDDSPDDDENRRETSASSTPGHNKELEDGETDTRNCLWIPQFPRHRPNLDITPLSNNVSTRRQQDISFECNSIAPPILRVDQRMGISSTIPSPLLPVKVMDLEPPQQCLPPKTPN